MDNTPEKLVCGRTEDEWIEIVHALRMDVVTLCKDHSLTYIQLNYVLGWILGWAADYVFSMPEKEKPNDDIPTP